MRHFDLLLVDIAEAVTLNSAYMTATNSLGRIPDAAIGIDGERIAFAGPRDALFSQGNIDAEQTVSMHGGVVFPGLIDSHTHLVFGGSRASEFARRIQGVPYMQIAAEGGGINATVAVTRKATEEELEARATYWLDGMLALGVTTVEAKSGYGLTTESELKLLRVMETLGRKHVIEVTPTFMGAHEIPPEYKNERGKYVELILDEMLPAVAEQGIARFCDVFCDKGVFSIEESRRILLKAMKLGLKPRLHADEFADTGAAGLAVEIGAFSADHLMAVSEEGIRRLAGSQAVATLLPGTSYYLGTARYAPARRLLESGIKVALATDFNPGSCMCANLQLVANMACTQLKMTFEEVLPALTVNAARSLDIQEKVGCLAEGKQADLLVLDIPRPEYFVYHVGRNHVARVMKRGGWVWENPARPLFMRSAPGKGRCLIPYDITD